MKMLPLSISRDEIHIVLKDILKNNGNNKNQDLEKKELSTSVLHYHKTTQYHNTYQEVNCGHNNVEFGHITFCV